MLNVGLQFFANPKRGNEIPTIDVVLVTITADEGVSELALDTASKIAVNPQVETKDAIKLIVKGRLIAQKPQQSTMTGTTIVLTDNVFNVEEVLILQGGTVEYKTPENPSSGVKKYTPPVAGSKDKGKIFKLSAYSAIYDGAGLITGYEKITYPNCQGTPVAFGAEDDVFRVAEYTINSAPKDGEAPYVIDYVDELPTVDPLGGGG